MKFFAIFALAFVASTYALPVAVNPPWRWRRDEVDEFTDDIRDPRLPFWRRDAVEAREPTYRNWKKDFEEEDPYICMCSILLCSCYR